MSINKVILIGRLGQDPELKYTTEVISSNVTFVDRNNTQQENHQN